MKKKKIKLILSDLHLGTGRSLSGGQINHLEEFYYDEKFVEFIHFYTHGKYQDYDVELIFNGDIFNFLQVDYKGHYVTVITESVTMEKMKNIVAGHKRFFDALKDFLSFEGNSITFIVGNHDQGMLWPGVRAYLNDLLGSNVRYKNIVYFFDGVHIEHGNMHEAANRLEPRKFFLKKNVAEPILNLPFGSHFFIDFVLKLKQKHPHVDKVRPFSNMVKWGVINEPIFTIKGLFLLIWYFFRSIFVPDPRRAWPVKRILKVFFESAIFPDLSDAARKILKDERIHTVIFGHTHVYQYRQFGAGKEYFNTGTWTELTSLDVASFGRITKLTYVLIEYPEIEGENPELERPRGCLKEWKGYHRIEEDVVIS